MSTWSDLDSANLFDYLDRCADALERVASASERIAAELEDKNADAKTASALDEIERDAPDNIAMFRALAGISKLVGGVTSAYARPNEAEPAQQGIGIDEWDRPACVHCGERCAPPPDPTRSFACSVCNAINPPTEHG
jgi:hypothetical protein